MKLTNLLFGCTLIGSLASCTDHQEHKLADLSMSPIEHRIGDSNERSIDCNIESINGRGLDSDTPVVVSSGEATVTGWLIDSSTKSVPNDVRIRVETESGDHAWEQQVNSWGDRGDVVSTHDGEMGFQKSGFNVALNIPGFEPGPYNIYLAFGSKGVEKACGIGRRFLVK